MVVLVTGATGFIGRVVCETLVAAGFFVRGTLRRNRNTNKINNVVFVEIGEIGSKTDWGRILEDVEVVVHLAARVHVMREHDPDPLTAYLEVNTAGTEGLARALARVGGRRLIYLSSIKVNGEGHRNEAPYLETDPIRPCDPYAISKWNAEQILFKIADETGLEIVVLRPPMVYGSGVKANFLRLMKSVQSGIPLPLSKIKNKRSFICVGNLANAIVTCVKHPAAAGETYLVSDGEDLSTPELIRRIGQSLGRSARLFSFPPSMLRMAGRLTGKTAMVDRLLNSLVIDSSKIFRELNWTPPYSIEQGLAETAKGYLNQINTKKV